MPKGNRTKAPGREPNTLSALQYGRLQAGTLAVVATPIGNLGDISLRALEILQSVDAIACEDTRVTRKLMDAHDISAKLLRYHDHNGAEMRPEIISRLQQGQRLALVSDAGTPLISDPGYKLVRAVRAAGQNVTVIPGASAVLSALCLAGLPTDRFVFCGFLPPKAAARKTALVPWRTVPASLVFYETAPRLASCLDTLATELGAREAAVIREVTKLFEETRTGTLPELAEIYHQEGPPKGEIVIVCGPPLTTSEEPSEEDLLETARKLLRSDSVRDTAKALSERHGLPRKIAYDMALKAAETLE